MNKQCFSPDEVKQKNKSSEAWTIVVVLAAVVFLISQCIHYALNQNKGNDEQGYGYDASSSGHGRMTRRKRKDLSKRRVDNESLRAALIKHKLQKQYGGGFVDNAANKNLIE